MYTTTEQDVSKRQTKRRTRGCSCLLVGRSFVRLSSLLLFLVVLCFVICYLPWILAAFSVRPDEVCVSNPVLGDSRGLLESPV